MHNQDDDMQRSGVQWEHCWDIGIDIDEDSELN